MTPSDLKQSDDRLYRSWAEWKCEVDALMEEFAEDRDRLRRELSEEEENRRRDYRQRWKDSR